MFLEDMEKTGYTEVRVGTGAIYFPLKMFPDLAARWSMARLPNPMVNRTRAIYEGVALDGGRVVLDLLDITAIREALPVVGKHEAALSITKG